MGNCTEKSAMLQKYFKNNQKSNKMVDNGIVKPPPPLESGLEGSATNLSVSSTPRQSRHKFSDYFSSRRADSLPRHLSHIKTIFKQNSDEKKPQIMPISQSSPNNFRVNDSRPDSQEINSKNLDNQNHCQRNSLSRIRNSRNPSLRISTSESSSNSKKRLSDTIPSSVTVGVNCGNINLANSSFRSPKRDIERKILIAMFDYHARTNEELSLRKGDRICLINEFDPDWWMVESLDGGEKGYIPSSFVAVQGSLESWDWFVKNISRKDAERLLLLQCNTQGTFLVRQSETSQGTLSLSVRDNEPNGYGSVKHYKIKVDTDGRRWYITSKCAFNSLPELVQYYSTDASGLCCRLIRACARPSPLTSDLSVRTKDAWWEIPRASIDLIEQLGSGQFGEVWRARYNGAAWVAVKTLRSDGAMTTAEFVKEARTMKALVHPRLVRLYGVVCGDPMYIVTELMTNGSLLTFLRNGGGGDLDISHLVDLMAQIASGMEYIEREGFIHRDLAARNILVGENNECKVADFGLARMTRGVAGGLYEAREGTKFPIKWTAPEAALMGRFTIKSDVWSFGVVMYEIVTRGKVPYPSMNNTDTLTEVENGYRMPCPPGCPSKIYSVMTNTWQKNPEDRPTFEYLCQFFENFYVHAEASYKRAAAAAAAAACVVSSNNRLSSDHSDSLTIPGNQQHCISTSFAITSSVARQHSKPSQEPELTAL